jgi:hypothetical protein
VFGRVVVGGVVWLLCWLLNSDLLKGYIMLNAMVTRTVRYTDIKYIKLVNGKPVEIVQRVYATVKDTDDAVRKLAKVGISNVAVVGYVAGSNAYRMTVADFVSHAEEMFDQPTTDEDDDGDEE